MKYEMFIPVIGVTLFILFFCLCLMNCICKMKTQRMISRQQQNVYYTGHPPQLQHPWNGPPPICPGTSYMEMQQTSWAMYGNHVPPPPPSYGANRFLGPRLTIPQPMPQTVAPISPPPPYAVENNNPPLFGQPVENTKAMLQ